MLDFPTPTRVFQTYRAVDRVWIWDGVAWYLDQTANLLLRAFSPAAMARLVYRIEADETDIFTLTPDLYTNTFALTTIPPLEPVAVHLNGVSLVLDDGSGTVGDYTVDRADSTVRLLEPVAELSVVQIDILVPLEGVVQGSVTSYALLSFDSDWVANPVSPPSGLQDGVNTAFPLYYQDGGVARPATPTAAAQCEIYVDGVRQRPGLDYTVGGAAVSMMQPPAVDSDFWGIWHAPAAIGAQLVLAPTSAARLVYNLAADDDEIITSVNDAFGVSYSLTGNTDAVQVHINGVMLVPDDGSGMLGDYVVTRPTSTITLLTPVTEASVAQIDILAVPDERQYLPAIATAASDASELDFGVLDPIPVRLAKGGTLHLECYFDTLVISSAPAGLLTVTINEYADSGGSPGAIQATGTRRLLIGAPIWEAAGILDFAFTATLWLPPRNELRHYEVVAALALEQDSSPVGADLTCWIVGE